MDDSERDHGEPENEATSTSSSNKQEPVEDRPNVGTAKPEDYPLKEREEVRPDRG